MSNRAIPARGARVRARRLIVPGALLACLVAAASSPAAAQERTDATHRYRVVLDEGWQDLPRPAGERAPLAGHEHRRMSALLAISRIDHANSAAWRRRHRQAYLDQVVEGVQASVQRFRRMEQKTRVLGIVPALDLVFRHRAEHGDEIVRMRYLFFRRYTLVLSLATPARAHARHRRALRKVQESFEPYFAR